MKRRNFLKGILPVAAMGFLSVESFGDALQIDDKPCDLKVGDTFTCGGPGGFYKPDGTIAVYRVVSVL